MYSSLTKRQQDDLTMVSMRQERSYFVPHWREIADNIVPRRPRFFISDYQNVDQRASKSIINSAATYAKGVLSAGMMSGSTNPASLWFRLTTPDPDLAELGSVKNYLHSTNQRMATALLKSNIYDSFPQFYEDLAVFGTAAMMIEPHFKDVIHTEVFPIGSYMIANDAEGQVRLFAREYRMSVRELIEKFGDVDPETGEPSDWSPFSEHVHQLWRDKHREVWIEVVHLIQPNDDFDPESLDPKHKRFASCYWEKGVSATSAGGYNISEDDRRKYLKESGFDWFPVIVARWATSGSDVWGTDCPGMTALGDIRQLQAMERRSLQAIDKMVAPPMIAPSGMRAKKVTTLPNETTWIDVREGMLGFQPAYQIKIDLSQLEEVKRQLIDRIYQAFFVNIILMLESLDRRQITATEIEERKREKLLALGRVHQRLDKDAYSPIIDILYRIMDERGMLEEAPEELVGVDLKVEYLSAMAQAQKLMGISSLERFMQFVQGLMAVYPQAADKVEFDQGIDEVGERLGIPPRVIVPDDVVAARRQARADQENRMRQAAVAEQMSKTAKTLSETDTEKKSALTDVMAALPQIAQPA